MSASFRQRMEAQRRTNTKRVPERLLHILEDLVDKQLTTFQWFLSSHVLEGVPHIPKSRIDGLSRTETVDVLVQTYGYDHAVTVTVEILVRMKLNLLAETLKRTYGEGKA